MFCVGCLAADEAGRGIAISKLNGIDIMDEWMDEMMALDAGRLAVSH